MGLVETTTYRVETVYAARTEGAAEGLRDLEKAADGAHHATAGVGTALALLATAAAGIHEAKKVFIDFNEETQNAKIGLSTMLSAGYGADYQKATAAAETLYSHYQKISQQLPITTKELTEFGNGITLGTIQAGGGLQDIELIAKQGSVAAKVFGKETRETSFAITEMLQGNARKQNSVVQLMLGLAHTDAKKFNALSGADRLATVEKVLNSSSMQSGMDAFANSFTGVVSTLEDKVQLFLGRVGLPLFKAVTAEVVRWSEYLDRNSDALAHFEKEVGSGLVSAFSTVKDAFAFLVEHRETLLTIGKVYAAIKIGSAAGGMIGSLGSSIGSLAGGGGGGAGGGQAAAVGAAAATGYAIGTILNDKYGWSDSIAGVVKVNGELLDASDKTTAGYARIAKNLNQLDTAIDDAKRHLDGLAGPAGTHINATVQGGIDYMRQQANVLQDHARGNDNSDAEDRELVRQALVGYKKNELMKGTEDNYGPGTGSYLGKPNRFDGTAAEAYANGDDSPGAKLYAAEVVKAYANQVEGRQAGAGASVSLLLPLALSQMTKAQQDSFSIDRKKEATELAMTQAIQMLAQGKTFGLKDMANILGATPADAFAPKQATNNYNVTNHITVEVSAKDPDRWMAELDERVSRRVRAPTQARGTIATRGGGR